LRCFDHLFAILVHQYRVQPGPVRAGLRARAQDWPWSSAAAPLELWPRLDPGPVVVPRNWLEYVNEPKTEAEVEALRECLRRGRPYGDSAWMERTPKRLGLESSLRPRGRPKKAKVGGAGLFESV